MVYRDLIKPEDWAERLKRKEPDNEKSVPVKKAGAKRRQYTGLLCVVRDYKRFRATQSVT